MSKPRLLDDPDRPPSVARAADRPSVAAFAEGLLLAHFRHIEDCDYEVRDCTCHFHEDLAAIRSALR